MCSSDLVALIFFAYSTILGWSYYGEKSFYYLVGQKGIFWYRLAFSILVFVGANIKLQMAWDIADTFNGAMAIPNLIALIALSGVVVRETVEFKGIRAQEKIDEGK